MITFTAELLDEGCNSMQILVYGEAYASVEISKGELMLQPADLQDLAEAAGLMASLLQHLQTKGQVKK